MRIKNIIKVIGLSAVLLGTPLRAQNGFFVGVDAASSNVWTAAGIQLITNLANYFLEDVYDGDGIAPAIGGRLTYEIMKFTDDNTKVMYNPDDWYGWRTVFGFRGKDLFSHIFANAKFGWMGTYSPIGVYIHMGYDFRFFSMMLSYQTEAQDYRIGTLNPGIGIRISPANFFESYANNKFVLEVGTNYNARVSYKGPYNNDKAQLNNGLSYVVSVGLASKYSSILLGVEWASHDLFNKEYTPDEGLFYPYYNLSSRIASVFLSINFGF